MMQRTMKEIKLLVKKARLYFRIHVFPYLNSPEIGQRILTKHHVNVNPQKQFKQAESIKRWIQSLQQSIT
jgi:hypothetical protein